MFWLISQLSLAAWGRLERFDQVDRPGIERFIVALAGRYDHRWGGTAAVLTDPQARKARLSRPHQSSAAGHGP